MKLTDIILLAVNNLRRNTMRTILTALGVAVGIGSLASMISFGRGMSSNVSKSMETNDIFTGLTVTSRDIDFQTFGNRNNLISQSFGRIMEPIGDSTIAVFESWPEVAMVFPEVVKPSTVMLAGRSVQSNLKAVPMAMGGFAPFSGIQKGRFFDSEKEQAVIISKSMLSQMNIRIEGDMEMESADAQQIVMPLDSILGHDLEVITKDFDFDKLDTHRSGLRDLPIKNVSSFLKIVGIVDNSSFTAGMFSNGVFLSSRTMDYIPSIDIQSVLDIMEGTDGKYGKYNSVHIRVKEHQYLKTIRHRAEQMGYQVFSIGDKLDDVERLFFVLDSILAAIGTIALLVSVLGIVNTLIMAIYERRKEIGIMKSLGATQSQIKLIFYFEAAIIGLLGGVAGVAGGALASKAASSIANTHISRLIDCDVEYFEFSWQLVAGAMLFSVIISVLASIYPANKASRIDPLDALRRE